MVDEAKIHIEQWHKDLVFLLPPFPTATHLAQKAHIDSLAFLVMKVIDFKGSERTRESIFSAEPKSGYTPMGARYTWNWYIDERK